MTCCIKLLNCLCGFKLAGNVSRPREVVKPANRVVSAKIEFLRENQTRRNRKPTISRDRCWQMAISKNYRFFQNQASDELILRKTILEFPRTENFPLYGCNSEATKKIASLFFSKFCVLIFTHSFEKLKIRKQKIDSEKQVSFHLFCNSNFSKFETPLSSKIDFLSLSANVSPLGVSRGMRKRFVPVKIMFFVRKTHEAKKIKRLRLAAVSGCSCY